MLIGVEGYEANRVASQWVRVRTHRNRDPLMPVWSVVVKQSASPPAVVVRLGIAGAAVGGHRLLVVAGAVHLGVRSPWSAARR